MKKCLQIYNKYFIFTLIKRFVLCSNNLMVFFDLQWKINYQKLFDLVMIYKY